MDVGTHSAFQRRRRRILAAAAASVASVERLDDAPPANAQSPGRAGRLPNPAASRTPEFFSPSEVLVHRRGGRSAHSADALGPGAVEAGVPVFIDRQLAGPFGARRAWYMQGPWAEGAEEQGYQTTPHAGRALSRRHHGGRRADSRQSSGRPFAALDGDDQDALAARARRRRRRAGRRLPPRRSSACCCRTPWKASSPIRSMAATATWSAGS